MLITHQAGDGNPIHRGTKEDFLAGMACSVVNNEEKTVTRETTQQNGKFSVQDIIDLTKMSHGKSKEETVYDNLTTKHAAEHHHISDQEILPVEDNSSAAEAITFIRKKFPGLISTSYAVDALKSKLKKECEAVLRPERCATGWRIDLKRLHTLSPA